ncbi:MAG: cysteine peptidase family C39 domain-containing protein [Microgenomates group bacterium]
MESTKKSLTGNLLRGALKIQDKVFGRPFPTMERVKQITSSHCGPAVLVSLFSFLGEKVSQKKITASLRAQKRIKKFGLSVKDLASATKIYGKDGGLVFWKKANAKISDLDQLINKYGFPVGVEWQGVFYEDEDEDNGHYSVVTQINKKEGYLRMADPYYRFAGHDRKFKTTLFVKRWWDTNLINKKVVYDKRVLFIVAPKKETFPKKLGMIRG